MSLLTPTLRIKTPRWALPLLQSSRYKAAYGGRGSGKSHFFCEAIIEKCLMQKARVVCIREVQRSIRDSVKQLLSDKIRDLNVSHLFEILDQEIRCANGSLIIFRGMQSYNAHNIKSLEDFDLAFVEEAQTLSSISWRLLRPTIRKSGSEIWLAWNPRHDTDAVDLFFRGKKKPKDAIIVNVNWNDNPWFPDELRSEKDHDYATDPDMSEHVWGGGYELISEASYYAKLIKQAENEGRIKSGLYNPKKKVITSWDIGVDDYTAIWFWQLYEDRAIVIDYYEVQNDGAPQIIEAALPEYHSDAAQGRLARLRLSRLTPFNYDRHYLPHDVQVREWGGGARSRIQTLNDLGLKNIKKGAQTKLDDRVNAVRQLLPYVYFEDNERVQVGVKRLRRYSRKYNEQMGMYQGALHDENSHAADSFGEFAINCPLIKPKLAREQKAETKDYRPRSSQPQNDSDWMVY